LTQSGKDAWLRPNAAGFFEHHDITDMMVLVFNGPMAANGALKTARRRGRLCSPTMLFLDWTVRFPCVCASMMRTTFTTA
jgi:hypothetical protein